MHERTMSGRVKALVLLAFAIGFAFSAVIFAASSAYSAASNSYHTFSYRTGGMQCLIVTRGEEGVAVACAKDK